jgi:TPR repeat protein
VRSAFVAVIAVLVVIPAKTWAQNAAIRACDLATASSFDPDRPAGIPGVDLNKIDITAAMPACEAALAVEPDNPRLLYQMGRIFAAGKDDDQAVSFFKKAAAASYAIARFELAQFYAAGRGGLSRDRAQVVSLLMLASEQGLPAADYFLGVFYERGSAGLPKDAEQAMRHFTLAADKGFAIAQNRLGIIYGTGGDGQPKDETKAAKFFKLAATQGDRNGQFNLGLLYENGRSGLPKSDAEAARLYKLAADQKSPDAEYRLALFYADGRGGLPKDNKEAVRLVNLAAEHGSMVARVSLGDFSPTGGVTRPREWMREFQAQVMSNWTLPPGFPAGTNIHVALRIHFNPDGTLSEKPEVGGIDSSIPWSAALAMSALKAVDRAQPFTMLKPDKYNEWKEIILDFRPSVVANIGGGGTADLSKIIGGDGTEGPH